MTANCGTLVDEPSVLRYIALVAPNISFSIIARVRNKQTCRTVSIGEQAEARAEISQG